MSALGCVFTQARFNFAQVIKAYCLLLFNISINE